MFMFDLFFKALNDEWEEFLALLKDRAHLIKCETYHNSGSTRTMARYICVQMLATTALMLANSTFNGLEASAALP